MKQSLEFIIFDLDGTLVNLNVDWQKVKERLNDIFNIEFEPLFLKIMNLKKFERMKACEVIKKFEIESYNKWEINTSLVNWIKKHHTHYQILLLTNNSRETTDRFLKKSELEKFIKFSLTIEETDFPKPNFSGLNKLFKFFSIEKDNVLLIGDSIREKILAENNDIDCIISDWINTNGIDLLEEKLKNYT